MRRIVKSNEPAALTDWKKNHPELMHYHDLNNKNQPHPIRIQGQQVINQIRTHNVTDQLGLCAYCMCRIEDNQLPPYALVIASIFKLLL